MPLFEFRCQGIGGCGKTSTEILPIQSKTRKIKCPNCGKFAKRLLGTGTKVDWVVPPGGHWFPTVGKTCYTKEHFLSEADKVKRKWGKEAEAAAIAGR